LSVKSSLGTVLILAKPKISESNVYIDGMWTPRYGFYRSGQKYSMITCNTPSQTYCFTCWKYENLWAWLSVPIISNYNAKFTDLDVEWCQIQAKQK